MLRVAYLANQFPAAVEPYVGDEIEELRGRGVRVVAGSVSKSSAENGPGADFVLRPISVSVLVQAIALCTRRWRSLIPFARRILLEGAEGPIQRIKAIVHTVWGGCLAVRLRNESVDHIHVHHGFSASWIGMVAARMLRIGFSTTLHGSDLLLHRAYLDTKLEECAFCLTVSEYNRSFILKQYPKVGADKIVVARLGVDVPVRSALERSVRRGIAEPFRILAVGRLHAVKDHAFLVRACAELRGRGIHFHCEIAGEGPERCSLERLIRKSQLQQSVHLFGHAGREQLDSLYEWADLVVLTSRSEGIPLVLMEAMARGKLVVAPAITGIPELVTAGTGFLYEPGSMTDFLDHVCALTLPQAESGCTQNSEIAPVSADRIRWLRHAARVHVLHNFNRVKNLKAFGDVFLRRVTSPIEEIPNESFVLQQIQLPVQRI